MTSFGSISNKVKKETCLLGSSLHSVDIFLCIRCVKNNSHCTCRQTGQLEILLLEL